MEADHFWFRSRNRLLTWALSRYFPAALSLLEVGCGTGFVLSEISRFFPKLVLYGSDFFVEGIAFARERAPEVSFLQMDAMNIPFEDEFDVIGLFDVLEHVEEDETALVQIRRATKTGGGLVLTVPQHPWLWSPKDDHAFHKRRYRRKELVQKVVRSGFDVVRVTSFVSILLPLMVVSRFKRRISRHHFDPMAEFQIGATANYFFEKLLSIERFLIQAGLSFPAGGSLLLIAKKR